MYRPEIGIRCKKLGINKDFYNEDEAYTYMAAKFPDINKEYFCQKYSRGHMVYHTRQLSPYPRNGRLTVSINKQRYRIDDLCKEIDKKYSV